MDSSCIATFVILFALSLTNATRWKDCGSSVGTIKSMSVSSCLGQEEDCPLKKGTNVTCTVTFVPNRDVKELKAEVAGLIDKIPIPFPLPNSNACLDSGLTCPLKSGQTYTYSVQLYIRDFYPKIEVVVEWSLIDQNSDTVVCFALPADIVA